MKRTLSYLIFTIVILLAQNFFIHAQDTPEQKYFEWTSLEFPKEVYQQRRERMIEELKKSGGGIFLTPSRDGYSSGETFRQLNDFMYFTGLEFPNSILVIDSDKDHVIVFGPSRDLRFESRSRKNDFPGRPLVEDPEIRTVSGIGDMQSVDKLAENMQAWIKDNRMFRLNQGRSGELIQISTGFTSNLTQELQLILHLESTYPNIRIANAYKQVALLRMIKSPEEIENLKKAIDITINAIKKASGFIMDGVDERTLEAELEAEYKRLGSPRTGFSSIIKSGPNSLWPWRILAAHYDRRNRAMKDGELVIFDVGCEYNYYTSDMGRTFPVSGEFTDEQREILEMEISISDAIIAAVKPGISLSYLQGLAEFKIPEEHKKYMQTGIYFGHHIGMSSGDPNLVEAKLQPGMVFTVEPWYYNHDKGISVFTEDIVLVTENGAELLTKALPRSPDQLEEMVAH